VLVVAHYPSIMMIIQMGIRFHVMLCYAQMDNIWSHGYITGECRVINAEGYRAVQKPSPDSIQVLEVVIR
jgi:hypothetical protein